MPSPSSEIRSRFAIRKILIPRFVFDMILWPNCEYICNCLCVPGTISLDENISLSSGLIGQQ